MSRKGLMRKQQETQKRQGWAEEEKNDKQDKTVSRHHSSNNNKILRFYCFSLTIGRIFKLNRGKSRMRKQLEIQTIQEKQERSMWHPLSSSKKSHTSSCLIERPPGFSLTMSGSGFFCGPNDPVLETPYPREGQEDPKPSGKRRSMPMDSENTNWSRLCVQPIRSANLGGKKCKRKSEEPVNPHCAGISQIGEKCLNVCPPPFEMSDV